MHIMVVDELENGVDSLELAASVIGRQDPMKWKWVAFAVHHALSSFCVTALTNGYTGSVIAGSRNDDDGKMCQVGNSPWRVSRKQPINGGPAYRIHWHACAAPPEPPLEEPYSPDDLLAQWDKRPLVGFWTLLARVQDGYLWMGRTTISRPVTLSDEDIMKILWLHDEVRNDLMHFKPKLLVIHSASVKSACVPMLNAIEFIAMESRTVLWPLTGHHRERTAIAIAEIRKGIT